MQWHELFAVWYIGCFLIVFGIAVVWRGQALSNCRRFFYFELRDPLLKERFSTVVQRRNELEGDYTTSWRVTGLVSMVFGALVLARLITPVVGYALFCSDVAIILSQIYSGMRNRSVRRAASLQPRSITTSVPIVWYAGGMISALLPLGLWMYPSARGPAVVVTVACAVILFVALRTSEMAALLAGDDPEIEVYVDNRLRWSRVAGLLALTYAASFVFIAVTGPPLKLSPPFVVGVNIASDVLVLGFFLWALVVYFRGRVRAKTTSA